MSDFTKTFVVYGVRLNTHPVDGDAPMMETEIIGVFPTFADAAMCRDIHADLDTTMEAVAITTTESYKGVPDYDVMLHMEVSPDGSIIEINSMCVGEESDPWLRETTGHCEALAVPEDMDFLIDYMTTWAQNNLGTVPVVEDNISPAARELIEGI